MRIDLPQCNLKTCRYSCDGNCVERNRFDGCEYAYVLEENDKLKAEVEQLKEDYRVLARQYNNVENSSIRYYNEVKQLKSELEQSVKLPLTNADKIRSMDDEELAEFLSETHDEEIGKFLGDIATCDNNIKSIVEWLQSEVLE